MGVRIKFSGTFEYISYGMCRNSDTNIRHSWRLLALSGHPDKHKFKPKILVKIIFSYAYVIKGRSDSVVGIATGYWLDDRGVGV
jgi:hypothetical protein